MKKRIKDETLFNKSGKKIAAIFLIWPLLHFCIWYVWLNYESIALAFTPNVNGGGFTLMYFKQFWTELTAQDTIIYKCLINTIKYFIIGILKLCASYGIAYFFFKKIYFHKIFEFCFFLPSMFSMLVYITAFKGVVDTYGPLDMIFKNVFGYEMPYLIGTYPTPLMLFYTFWSGFGVSFMIFVGSMNRIPTEIFEAAALDGCNWWKELTRMVLPLTSGLFLTYLILSFAGILNSSGPIFYFVGMNEAYGNEWTFSFFVYSYTRKGMLNYAAAINVIITLVTFPIVIIVRHFGNKLSSEVAY